MSQVIDLSLYLIEGRLYNADFQQMHMVTVLYECLTFEIVRVKPDYHEIRIFEVADIPINQGAELIDFSETLMFFLLPINFSLWLPIVLNLRRFGIL